MPSDPTPRTAATARALRERLENHVAEATETGVWDLAGWTATLDDLIALAAAPSEFAALVDEARANHVRWEHEAEVLEECNRPLCLGARVLLWPDPDAPRSSALAAAEARPNATAATARERVKAMQRALLMSPRVRDGVWLRDSGHQYRAAEEVLAEFDQALAIPASPAGVAALTPGDFAKALHDAHRVLGYWPDPDVIDGRWEMWGVVLHSLLAAPASPAGVSYPRVPLTEGYVWCESCTGQGVLQKVEPLAPAPTPSEPGANENGDVMCPATAGDGFSCQWVYRHSGGHVMGRPTPATRDE